LASRTGKEGRGGRGKANNNHHPGGEKKGGWRCSHSSFITLCPLREGEEDCRALTHEEKKKKWRFAAIYYCHSREERRREEHKAYH